MSDLPFHAGRPGEQEAVRTTIVGGRPPGSGQEVGPVPRGIEILLRKASIDPAFKELLLRQRGGAAEAIGLTLEPGEAMMLASVPTAQLEAVIARAFVPQEHRRAFLGQAAAAMLAALGVTSSATAEQLAGMGGMRLDPSSPLKKTVAERVIKVLADRTGIEAKDIKRSSTLFKDLKIKAADIDGLRKDLEKEFDIEIPAGDFKNIRLVGMVIARVEKVIKDKKSPPKQANPSSPIPPPPPFASGGIRPS
jgi:acyl carrier protein